ncbi:MAG: hypothetical protein WBC91_06275 [Phototrophicaceae bacterium]
MEMIGLGIGGLLATAVSVFGYLEVRRVGRTAQLVDRLQQYEPLFLSDRWTRVRYTVVQLPEESNKWQRGTLLITHKRIAMYPYTPDDPETAEALFTINPHEIQGFWRPIKYMAGENEIWIHAQIGDTWQILKMKLYQYDMQDLIRAMKVITTPEQITAYRRRRPYIHRALTTAFPAHQTLTGAWETASAVQLYLMPLYLIILVDGKVHERIDLKDIQDIAALKRMDGGKPEGLVRVFVDNVLRAFALNEYEAWAQDLAEASKRTLEEPVTRKRKSKDEDEDFDE